MSDETNAIESIPVISRQRPAGVWEIVAKDDGRVFITNCRTEEEAWDTLYGEPSDIPSR